MFAGIAVLLILAAFGMQLLFCFCVNKHWIRWIPTALVLAGELVCGAAFLVCIMLEKAGKGIFGAAFAVYLYGLMLLVALGGTMAACLIYAVVRFAQKGRK